jgi:hypothetical protein
VLGWISDVNQHNFLFEALTVTVIINVTCTNLTNESRQLIKVSLIEFVRCDRTSEGLSANTAKDV